MARPLLLEQNAALLGFLDDLLTEEPQAEPAAAELPQEPALTTDTVTPVAEREIPIAAEELALDGTPTAEIPEAIIPAQEMHAPAGRIPIVPDWGREAFQAMVFKVGELSLAIPLVELAGVVEWQPELIDSQGASGLCMGHFPHAGQSVTVIDTARFIFPEQHLQALGGPHISPRLSRIVLINQGNIGLACNEVFEVITIESAQVNWRSDKTRRQWLAGTMLDQLIAVLDARTTAEILTDERDIAN